MVKKEMYIYLTVFALFQGVPSLGFITCPKTMNFLGDPKHEMVTSALQTDFSQGKKFHGRSLFLHPDQAAELEAAATEMMNSQNQNPIQAFDDTNQPTGHSLSGSAALPPQNERPPQLWSRAFLSLLGRGRS
jgi:hypothetical protein